MNSLFVLGGARSGKSSYAQARAEALEGELIFVATGQAFDTEMADRIARHRADRGPRWTTIEAPVDLAATLRAETREDRVLLIDCLTLWTSNLLLAERDIPAAATELVEAIVDAAGPLILVANEVGLGIVPDNALARRFRDEAGRVNQQVAAAVDGVMFIAAGLSLKLK